MSKQLLEADFLTLDTQQLFGNKQADAKSGGKDAPSAKAGGNKAPAGKGATLSARTDWGKELSRRIEANKALDPESRESEFDIESRFWDDYFAANKYDPDVAEWLKTIDQLKKDFKALGFKAVENPLVSFFKNKWVQTNLVKTKLINTNTYKAIHNAIAKRYVADSEFLKSNDYNIIYCKDWYAQQLPDMVAYLEQQKKTLPPSGISHYDKNHQERNISAFLVLGAKSVRASNAKLNKLDEVKTRIKNLASQLGTEDETQYETDEIDADDTRDTDTDDREVATSGRELRRIISDLSAEQCLAGLQYLCMLTNNTAAREALRKGNKLHKANVEYLIAASEYIAKVFKAGMVTAKNVEDVAGQLLTRLKTVAKKS